MECRFENIELRGVAASLPAQLVELRTLAADFGETEVQRIIASTGIEAVRIAPPSVTASDLCELAGRELLREMRVEPAEVDGIVFVSQTPDFSLPATSICLQHRLGLPKSAPAFDIPSGCSGYIYGLLQSCLLISSGACRQVLVCAGDTISRYIHPKDRSVRLLFGDAGSATLVARGNGAISFALYSDGSGASHLIIPAGGSRQPRTADTGIAKPDRDGNLRSLDNIYMNGAEIMDFALRTVPKLLDQVLTLAGWAKESVGLYAMHQANKFMIDYLARISRLPKGTVPVGMGRTGNAGPASIPLLLTVKREEFPAERRVRAVFCGFGVGLSWGGCAVSLGSTVILPPIEMAGERP